MGRISRRLSISSSKSRTKSLNPETGVADVEDTGVSQELTGDQTINGDGGETQAQEVAPSDGATAISSASATQNRRPSLLARLRRRSSSVAPTPVDDNPAGVLAVVPDDVVAAAAAAEVARDTGAGGTEDTSSQRGRESRRSSFSMVAKARAALAKRSLSRASSRENHLNINTGVTSPAPTPSKQSLLEAAPEGCSNRETAKTNSPYVPAGVPLARYLTEDGHDEEAAPLPHFPLEEDPLDINSEEKEKSSMMPLGPAPAPEEQTDILRGKQEPVVEQEELNSKDDLALSETSDQLTVLARNSLAGAADATVEQDGQQQQEEGTSAKAEEEGTGTVPEKPKRKLGLGSRKKEGRSSGGSTKNESRKERDGKMLKKGTENQASGGEKEEESLRGASEAAKPASRWRRRLSLSRERRHSTQSGPLNDDKKEDERGSVFGCESVCTEDSGKPGYFRRIRRRISLSRERRAAPEGSTIKKNEGTEEERAYTGAGVDQTRTGREADEAEWMSGFTGTEGELVPKRASGWSRFRRSSISSVVATARGRSRDTRAGTGAQQQQMENIEQDPLQQENSGLPGEKQSFAKSLRRRLSRSSLRLPRPNSRESSVGSKCQDESLCGNTDDGTESLATEKEAKSWRRRISDRFRSKSREPPLPSPTGTTSAVICTGGSAGTEERRLYPGDVKNSEYGRNTKEQTNAAEELLARAMKGDSTQEDAQLAGESQDKDYNSSEEKSSGEKQTHAKGTLSEELSEPFAVTPETSQTPSEQPSSADMTPRYQGKEYTDGQKYRKRAGKTAENQQRDRSLDAFAEKTHGRGGRKNEAKEAESATRKDGSTIGSGAEDFMHWMNQSQDEDDDEEDEELQRRNYTALPDERGEQGYDPQRDVEDGGVLKKTNAEGQRREVAIFFCCGSDDSESTNEKDKWKNTLQQRLNKGEGGEEKYRYAHDTNRRKLNRLPQPLLCKDLFDDVEIGYVYPLSYAPTDCLLELGLAI